MHLTMFLFLSKLCILETTEFNSKGEVTKLAGVQYSYLVHYVSTLEEYLIISNFITFYLMLNSVVYKFIGVLYPCYF
jgi:uncharacterized membrane protein